MKRFMFTIMTVFSVGLFADAYKIAVMDLEPKADFSKDQAQQVTDIVRTGFVNTGKFAVVERSQLNRILSEQEFSMSGAAEDTETAVRIGQLVVADFVVVGTVGRLLGKISLNLRIINVSTGMIDAAQSVLSTDDSLFNDILPMCSTIGTSALTVYGMPAVGDTTQSNMQLDELSGLGDRMIFLEGGSFRMGDDKFGPVHKVKVSGFYLGATEVDAALFNAVVNWAIDKKYLKITGGILIIPENGRPLMVDKMKPYHVDLKSNRITISGDLRNPITSVTWFGAAAFCNYLSIYHGLTPAYDLATSTWNRKADGYRLPTEAEWEYAARHKGKDFKYPWGNGAPLISGKPAANIYDDTSYQRRKNEPYHPHRPIFLDYDDGYDWITHVAHYPANELGFYDLGGNAQEWVFDYFAPYSLMTDPDYTGPDNGTIRVLRDCAPWNDHEGDALRVAFRVGINVADHSMEWEDHYVAGFRLARNK